MTRKLDGIWLDCHERTETVGEDEFEVNVGGLVHAVHNYVAHYSET